MSDNNERQWFENSNVPSDARRNSKNRPPKKGPADSARKNRKAIQVQGGNKGQNRPPRPNGPKPASQGQSGKPQGTRPQGQPGNTNAPVNQGKNPSKGNKPAVNPQGKPAGKKSPSKPMAGQKRSQGKPDSKSSRKPSNSNQTPFPMKEEAIRAEEKKRIEAKKKAEAREEEKAKKAEAAIKAKSDPKDIRKKSARRSALFNSALATVAVLVAVIVVFVIVHHFYNYFAVKPNLEFVTTGSIEHTIGSRAIFVRDESIVISGHSGDVVTEAAEGSRVAAGQSLAMVVPDDMQAVVINLRNTQSQISDVQQELIAQGLAEGAENIYSDINQSLDPIVNMLRLDASVGNLSEISSYSSSISVLLNQRELELSELDFDDERLRTLRSDERGYESTLESRATVVNATEPGIVSYKLDGLENTLSFEVLMNTDAGSIRDFINNGVGVIPSNLRVEAGQPIARIAQNNEQYIACFLNESDAPSSAFEIGTQHTIIVGSEGVSIGKCIVERIQITDNGNYLVVFSTTRYVEDLLDVRTADIEVVITETTGMRVPTSSLVNPDYSRGVATIYVNDQGFCTELGVLIQDYDREFAIISPMGDAHSPSLQTVYITNPNSARPGDQVS